MSKFPHETWREIFATKREILRVLKNSPIAKDEQFIRIAERRLEGGQTPESIAAWENCSVLTVRLKIQIAKRCLNYICSHVCKGKPIEAFSIADLVVEYDKEKSLNAEQRIAAETGVDMGDEAEKVLAGRDRRAVLETFLHGYSMRYAMKELDLPPTYIRAKLDTIREEMSERFPIFDAFNPTMRGRHNVERKLGSWDARKNQDPWA